jgi:hypothetical protein
MDVSAVARFPAAFRARDTETVVDLVRRSGIADNADGIAVQPLRAFLMKHPELVPVWEGWSEDKRTSQGWYFLREGDRFVVGFYPTGPRNVFDDRFEACATFIVHEMQELMSYVR